jgi:hypothetical protein
VNKLESDLMLTVAMTGMCAAASPQQFLFPQHLRDDPQ